MVNRVWSDYSPTEMIGVLGERFREYRMRMEKTQEEIAAETGVSLSTIRRFEAGGAVNISMSTFLVLLRAVGRVQHMEQIMPELPPSPYLYRENKVRQRIRHSKQ